MIKATIGVIACAAATVLGAVALYQGVVVRTYTIATKKWSSGGTLRLALVSDLHSQTFGKDQSEILNPIMRYMPEYILLAGDIIDERMPVDGARKFMQGAVKIAPTYYAPGNHEYRTYGMRSIYNIVESCGTKVLTNRYEKIRTHAGEMILAGCEDPEKARRQDPFYNHERMVRKAFSDIAISDAFTILIAHQPHMVELYKSLGFDLVVSGHAHGGQVRIPWLINGVYATNQGLFPKYTGGCYRHQNMVHVISRGLSKYPYIPRVFNPPEVVFINVQGVR